MGQGIQEWAKYNLRNTAIKKFEVIWSAQAEHITSNFLKAVFHKFYFVHSWILDPTVIRYWWALAQMENKYIAKQGFLE